MQRQPQLAEDRALFVLQVVPLGVLLGLLDQRVDQLLGVATAAGAAESGRGQRLRHG